MTFRYPNANSALSLFRLMPNAHFDSAELRLGVVKIELQAG
jgi:hypothetical protein